MKTYSILLRLLVFAALADWLVGRTLTRLAIFIPKPPFLIWLFESIDAAGRTAATLAGIITITILLSLAWRHLQAGQKRFSAFSWLILVSLSVGFLFVQPGQLLMTGFQLLLGLSLLAAGWYGWKNGSSINKKLAVLLPTLALAAGTFAHTTQFWFHSQTISILQTGELFVVMSTLFLWLAYGRRASWRMWLGAFLPVLVFTGGLLSNPAETGILAIWSLGLTLYLPWPVYSISLWLAGVTVLSAVRQEGWQAKTLLLLAAGGFAPQLSTHAFYGLIGLLLFSITEASLKQQTVLENGGTQSTSKKAVSAV
jgi:hypothetical protein